MSRALLAVDIGTTGVRAVAYTPHGAKLAEASAPCPYEAPREGWAQASAGLWWSACQSVVGQVLTRVSPEKIAAIGVTGQAPTAVVVDEDGEPLGLSILWLDTRSSAQAEALRARLGEDEIARVSGNRMHAYFLGPKLAWLLENEPATMERAAYVLQSHAFLVMKLTGACTVDFSTAALCAPLYDAASRAWSPAMHAALGVREGLLGHMLPADAIAGEVTAEAARATGLREGTPVVVGGGDFAASALGSGVVEEGEACLMLGTAGNLLMPLREARFDRRMINAHHVGTARFLTLGGTMCGGLIAWFLSLFGGGASLESLEDEARAVPAGASGLLLLPYLQGERTPLWSVDARGVYFGLSLTHGRGHLYRALLEAIALSFVHCQRVVEDTGVRLGEVLAANGGGKSALLRQILCDALGVPLHYAPKGGGTVAGAALLAGLGVGLLPNAAASRRWRGELVHHEPDARAHALYRALFEKRLALYDRVEPLFVP